MSDADLSAVRCMYLPLAHGGLLVPSSSVAEIVVVPDVEPATGAPTWIDGCVAWRGVRLPLLNAEVALGRAHAGLGAGGRVAVMHVQGDAAAFEFYGIGIQRLPTVVLASERSAQVVEPDSAPAWVHGQVQLDMGDGLVPHFGVLERMIGAVRPDP